MLIHYFSSSLFLVAGEPSRVKLQFWLWRPTLKYVIVHFHYFLIQFPTCRLLSYPLIPNKYHSNYDDKKHRWISFKLFWSYQRNPSLRISIFNRATENMQHMWCTCKCMKFTSQNKMVSQRTTRFLTQSKTLIFCSPMLR